MIYFGCVVAWFVRFIGVTFAAKIATNKLSRNIRQTKFSLIIDRYEDVKQGITPNTNRHRNHQPGLKSLEMKVERSVLIILDTWWVSNLSETNVHNFDFSSLKLFNAS